MSRARRSIGLGAVLVGALSLVSCGAGSATLDAGAAATAPGVDLHGCDVYGPQPADPADVPAWLEQVRGESGKVVVAGWPDGEIKGYLRWDEYRAVLEYRPPPGTPEEMRAASEAHEQRLRSDPLVVFDCRTDEPTGRWIDGFGWVSTAEFASPNFSVAAVVVDRSGPEALDRWAQAARFWDLTRRRALGPLPADDEAAYQQLLRTAMEQVLAR